MDRLQIWTDGGARPNPGEAGIGIVIRRPGEPDFLVGQHIGKATNNEAEYMALLLALRYAVMWHAEDVLVRADSLLMVNQINGVWGNKEPRLRVLMEKAQELAAQIRFFKIIHVRREQNAEADRLVNEALDVYEQSTKKVSDDETAETQTAKEIIRG